MFVTAYSYYNYIYNKETVKGINGNLAKRGVFTPTSEIRYQYSIVISI